MRRMARPDLGAYLPLQSEWWVCVSVFEHKLCMLKDGGQGSAPIKPCDLTMEVGGFFSNNKQQNNMLVIKNIPSLCHYTFST